MANVGDILTRMKELATQAASANVGTDISKVSDEYNTLVSEIDRIANSTKYAGTKLTDGTFGATNSLTAATSTWDSPIANVYDVNVASAATGAYTAAYSATANTMTITKGTVSETKAIADGAQTVTFSTFGISFKTTAAAVQDTVGAAMAGVQTVESSANEKKFQIGYNNTATEDQLSVAIANIKASALKTTGAGLAANDIDTTAKAFTAITNIDDAISTLSSKRATIGAYQNRLGYAGSNLSVTLENFTAAESSIRDVDMAAEMTTFTKNQILVQAGTAMLSQANQAPQQVLSLFR
jgi:flagellin